VRSLQETILRYQRGELVPVGVTFANTVGTTAGTTYELPSLGRMSWENAVANPATATRTVVVGTDDATPGQVYVYVGEKQSAGNPVQRAGLVGGTLYGVKVDGAPVEDRTTGVGADAKAFTLASLGDASTKTGAQLDAQSKAMGVTDFLRPEDGAWDAASPNDFYFVTTDRFNTVKRPGTAPTANTPPGQEGASRLYRLRFTDRTNPQLGGTITELIDGSTGQAPVQMMDNLTVDRGYAVIQEDPGNQPYSARVWQYSLTSGELVEIARHDPERFGNDEGMFPSAKEGRTFSRDEESSGVIDVAEILGKGWYLLDVQAHSPYEQDPTLVEDGQLLALFVPAPKSNGTRR
jgi:hypothetical protein